MIYNHLLIMCIIDTHRDLKCPCGCGEIVVLVAGSVRRQHFRLLKRFENTNCNDTEEYVVSFCDGRPDAELIPLSGFRNHGFNPDSPELGVQHNTVNIMSAVHIILERYLELYKTNIALIMGTDPAYVELYRLIELEQRYLDEVKQVLKGRSPTAPKGDENRLAYYGDKIKNLRVNQKIHLLYYMRSIPEEM